MRRTPRQLGNALGIAGLPALAQWAAGRATQAAARAGESAEVIGNIARGELAGALALMPADRQDAIRALSTALRPLGSERPPHRAGLPRIVAAPVCTGPDR